VAREEEGAATLSRESSNVRGTWVGGREGGKEGGRGRWRKGASVHIGVELMVFCFCVSFSSVTHMSYSRYSSSSSSRLSLPPHPKWRPLRPWQCSRRGKWTICRRRSSCRCPLYHHVPQRLHRGRWAVQVREGRRDGGTEGRRERGKDSPTFRPGDTHRLSPPLSPLLFRSLKDRPTFQ